MAVAKFTKEELAELAKYDAMIDAEDELTEEEIELSDKRDAQVESYQKRQARNKQYLRNRERRLAYSKEYNRKNKDRVKAWKAAYYQTHKADFKRRRKVCEARNSVVYSGFGAMIRKERLTIGLKAEYAARAYGCSLTEWYRLERGLKAIDWERVQAVLPGIGPKPKDFPQ